jgi:hypothetical protein
MLQFKAFLQLDEETEGWRSLHWKLGKGKRGKARPAHVRRKISNAMKGSSNFEGQKHDYSAKQKIKDERGHDDRVDGRKWVQNKNTGQTFRKYRKPDNYRWGR